MTESEPEITMPEMKIVVPEIIFSDDLRLRSMSISPYGVHLHLSSTKDRLNGFPDQLHMMVEWSDSRINK